MNPFVEKLQSSAESYMNEIRKDSRYSSIIAEVEVIENPREKGLNFTSNAGVWLSNSYTFSRLVSEFVRKEYESIGMNEGLSFNLKLKRETMLPEKKDSKNRDVSQVEVAEFNPETPKYRLEDVILPEDTMNSINDAISTIENFDIVYNQWNFKSKEPSAKTNICFFGSPGTGKTMCAHAIAEKLGRKILIASYADIQSQYVGVGPKNLKAVFQQAESSNAVLFFDEADSFLRKRTSDNSSSASMHYNSMTNEMMKHLEDFNGVVIFATNLTENTDEAFKTRLSFSIEFKVPDEDCRMKIIKGMIPDQVPLESSFTEDDFREMSKVCEGMVGRDIRNSIKTILSVGAQKREYPFSKTQFVEGFKTYKENKSSFEKDNSKKEGANPMDIYTANGCIHNLLTYVAWMDGKENELESEYLKLFSKVLSRNKIIVNDISDLPEFEELCHEIKEESLKKKAMRYLAYFMANTDQSNELYVEVSEKLRSRLLLSDEFMSDLEVYFTQSKQSSMYLRQHLK